MFRINCVAYSIKINATVPRCARGAPPPIARGGLFRRGAGLQARKPYKTRHSYEFSAPGESPITAFSFIVYPHFGEISREIRLLGRYIKKELALGESSGP